MCGAKYISNVLPDRPFTGQLRQDDLGLGDISSSNNNSGQPELDLFIKSFSLDLVPIYFNPRDGKHCSKEKCSLALFDAGEGHTPIYRSVENQRNTWL